MLTLLAWFAFDRPAPFLLIDGNLRGVRKGLSAEVISIILFGRRFSTMAYTNDLQELRKKITSLSVERERAVMLDNLAGTVVNDVFDKVLTSTAWKDRLLAMESSDERPELNGDFRYKELRTHVRKHRAKYLSAALTILRGWHVAGRPTHNLPNWGSYEGWLGMSGKP